MRKWNIAALAVVGACLIAATTEVAVAQAADTPWQVTVAQIRNNKDLSLSNSGASSTVADPQNGGLCANLYAMDPGTGGLLNCCTCRLPANSLRQVSVKSILAGSGPSKGDVVVKAMASTGSGGNCNFDPPGVNANVLATGMLAWNAGQPFTPATLSAAELNHLNSQCNAPQSCATCPDE